MLEFVVLNPPTRGGKRKKKNMAKARRKRKKRRNPFYWTPAASQMGHTPGAEIKDFLDRSQTQQTNLWNNSFVTVKKGGMGGGGGHVQSIEAWRKIAPTKTKIKSAYTAAGHPSLGEAIIKSVKAKGTRASKGAAAVRKGPSLLSAKQAKKNRKKAAKARAKAKAKKKKKTTRRASKKKKKKKTTRSRSRSKKKKKKTTRRRSSSKKKTTRRASKKKTSRKKKKKTTRSKSVAAKRKTKRRKGTRRVTLRKGRRLASTKTGRKTRKALKKGGYMDKAGRINPPKRRRKRKGKKKRTAARRRRRRRRNPTIMGTMKSIFSFGTLIQGTQGLVGMSAATVGPAYFEAIAAKVGLPVRNEGFAGVGLSAASTALAVVGASYLEKKVNTRLTRGLSRNVALGGVLVTTIKLVTQAAPMIAEFLKLPAIRTPAPAALGDWVGLSGPSGPYAIPSSDIRGIGAFMPNEALVAGESFAQSVNQFAGLPMGQSYPGQYGGMGSWLETVTPGAPLNPGSESF